MVSQLPHCVLYPTPLGLYILQTLPYLTQHTQLKQVSLISKELLILQFSVVGQKEQSLFCSVLSSKRKKTA